MPGIAFACFASMARALWKGLVNFGLVNIPVELHTGARDHTPRFRLLHRTDLSPIKMERICQTDGKAVGWEDLVKGYEVEKGRFVAVTQDDFRTAALERSRSIDILAFVPRQDIDIRYWDTPYIAVPAKGAEHSYALLAQALDKSGRVGISKYVMRQRQHLAALLPIDGRLVVSTMRFQEDLVELPAAASRQKIAGRELDLAEKLIEGMADRWEPEKYTDDYVAALMKVIEAKAEGEEVRVPKAKAQRPTNVVDLVERLRASLAQTSGSGASRAKRGSARKTASAKTARSRTGSRKAKRPARSRRHVA
jgi:DNA end-binding protein Ku